VEMLLETFEYPMVGRIVVIGDLNGQFNVLVRLLRGLRLIRKNGAWSGGKTVLIQIGDVPNRGPGVRAAMEFLSELRSEARASGGDVIWLLGNHEVLSTLRHEAYVTAEEYIEFATELEIEQFLLQRSLEVHRLLGSGKGPRPIAPIGGRMRAWEENNAPGKGAYRREMGASGRYGSLIRQLPIAVKIGSIVFVHAGLTPEWAQHGLLGIERLRQESWSERPEFYEDLDAGGVLRDPDGPLWHREYCFGRVSEVRRTLRSALDLLDAGQMVIGHTRTDAVRPDDGGRPSTRLGGRLVMSDVGLGDPGRAGSALVIERGRIEAWFPGGQRSRLTDVRKTS
jgi:hypothetical protein